MTPGTIGLILKALFVAAILAIGVAIGMDIGKKEGLEEGHAAGVKETTALYKGRIEQQQAQAQHELDVLTARNETMKADFQKLDDAWKANHDQVQKKLDTLAASNRSLLNANKQLRDPYAVRSACRSGSEGTGKAASPDPSSPEVRDALAGGVLSAELSGFLLGLASRADERNHVANECIAYRDAVEAAAAVQ